MRSIFFLAFDTSPVPPDPDNKGDNAIYALDELFALTATYLSNPLEWFWLPIWSASAAVFLTGGNATPELIMAIAFASATVLSLILPHASFWA